MAGTMDGLSFKEQVTRLTGFADAIVNVIGAGRSMPIEEVLARSASECHVAPAQMKYALSFADAEGRVEINFDDATVRELSPAN